MSWLSSLFPKQRRNINFVIILLLAILLIVGGKPVTEFVSQVVHTSFYYPFFKIRIAIENLQDESKKNEMLQQALVETSVKLSFYEEFLFENERLRETLNFEHPEGYRLLPAKVISVTWDNQPTLISINKGYEDSVEVNYSVVNKDGLIGKIINISSDYATVQLLTHPANKVSARIAQNREMGIVEFDAGKGMILKNVPIQSEVQAGDTIISSGLGGIYPVGLNVAVVTEVIKQEEEPFCEIKLNPTVNFFTIEELFVLKMKEKW